MKLLAIKFESSVDLSRLAERAKVTVSDGTTTVNGEIFAETRLPDPPQPELVPHSHPALASVDVSIGPAA